MTVINEEKWKALEQNAELKAALETANSPEKAYEILKRYGADVSLEEVREMIQEEGVLSENDLDDVAGGVGWRRVVGCRIVILFNPFRVKMVPIYG